MNTSGIKPQDALRQIDEMHALIKGNIRGAISGSKMMVTGALIACIPFAEMLFNRTLDPFIMSISHQYALYILFGIRTAFYWTFFSYIGHFFTKSKEFVRPNPLLSQLFAIGKVFPIIPVATAAMLEHIGQSSLIAPIILIMIGILFVIFGQFAARVVSLVAWANIIAGLVGIYVSSLNIPHLWAYLVIYQGLSLVVMGALLRTLQQHDQ